MIIVVAVMIAGMQAGRWTVPPLTPAAMEEVFVTDAMICRPKWAMQAHADLKRHEGFRPYAYPDPLSPLGQKHGRKFGYKPAREVLATLGTDSKLSGGPWTVGYGFTHGVTIDTRMTQEEADEALWPEIFSHAAHLDKLVPGWGDMPLYVQSVLVNLVFNLGPTRLAKFKNTLKLFNDGKYAAAASALTQSLWFKQVGDRAVELTKRLAAGSIPSKFAVIT